LNLPNRSRQNGKKKKEGRSMHRPGIEPGASRN
jgi:hypothetical protein